MRDLIACSDCQQCNRRGKPSVMRGSMYCDTHKRGRPVTKGQQGFLSRLKDRFFEKRTVKDKETQEIKEVRTKGFRESWFYR